MQYGSTETDEKYQRFPGGLNKSSLIAFLLTFHNSKSRQSKDF
ncbi:hypothetical protein D1AOALGA4SA_4978 [Olavius algarvensis Delta 1 endosymbiont]|nr:hypothetical protein D1AOALGA4SA_4978 [Olavius algarvensis Delta 1 endosymbiont]